MKKIKFRKEPGKQYDEDMRKAAVRKVGIIYLVAAYIIYQAYGIVQTKLAGTTSMSWTEVIIAAAVLGVGSLTVAFLATLKMGRELAESEIMDAVNIDDKNADTDTSNENTDTDDKNANTDIGGVDTEDAEEKDADEEKAAMEDAEDLENS